MRKIFVLVAVLGAIALLSIIAPASAGSARCEGCNPLEFKEKAEQLGAGNHIITSFTTDEIRGYEVSYTGGVLTVETSTVPDGLLSVFAEAHEFFVLTNGTAAARVEILINDLGVPGGNGATVFDVMGNANLRAMIGDRLVQKLPGTDAIITRAIEGIRNGAYSYVGLSDGIVLITVITADGGRVVYQVTVQSVSAEYVSGSGRTDGGQLVPDSNSPNYTGTWHGSIEDLGGLGDHLNGLGALLNQTGQGQLIESITCTWNGRTLQCIVNRTSSIPNK